MADDLTQPARFHPANTGLTMRERAEIARLHKLGLTAVSIANSLELPLDVVMREVQRMP